jgi:hypothetical protein
MGEIIYILCGAMSTVCSVALLRSYHKNNNRLLLWGGLCFGLLALNNIFLCIDLIAFPTIDLNGPLWRNFLSASAGTLLLFGLIMELS